MKICYLTSKSKESVVRQLERSYNESNNLIPYDTNIRDLTSFAAVCLVEPFQCKSDLDEKTKKGPYLSIFEVWKRYIAETAPAVKLFILRYTNIMHSNVIPIFSLHANFAWEDWIQKAQPCQAKWEEQLIFEEESVLKRLQTFFEGHNNRGFIVVVSKVRQELNHLYNQLSIKGADAFPDLWREQLDENQENVRVLYHRWLTYKPYFKAMPFWRELAELQTDQFFYNLLHVYQGDADLSEAELIKKRKDFLDLNAFERLDIIQSKLNYFNKKYITPENYGTVLIIDDDIKFHERIENSFPSYEFQGSYGPKEGKEKIQQNFKAYKFILLDLKFDENRPTDEGLEVLTWCRQYHPDLPVIVCSNTIKQDLHNRSIRLGAAFFLGKHDFDITSWNNIFLKALVDKENIEKRIYATPPNKGADKIKILLVEDDDTWVRKMQNSLSEFYFTVAYTAQQARDLVKAAAPFDIILLDLILEDEREDHREGLDMIDFFNRELQFKVPVIAISRKSNEDLITEALTRKATDFLRKDHFNIQIWSHRIKNYVRKPVLESS